MRGDKERGSCQKFRPGKVLVGFAMVLKIDDGSKYPKHGCLSSNSFIYSEQKALKRAATNKKLEMQKQPVKGREHLIGLNPEGRKERTLISCSMSVSPDTYTYTHV